MKEIDWTPTDTGDYWRSYLKKNCMADIIRVQMEYPLSDTVVIDVGKIFDNELWKQTLERPRLSANEIKEKIVEHFSSGKLTPESKIRLRFINVSQKRHIRELFAGDEGKLIALTVLVKRVSQVHPKIMSTAYKCAVGHHTFVKALHGIVEKPTVCSTSGCTSKKFAYFPQRDVKKNRQWIYVQDNLEDMGRATQPATIKCEALEGLCNQVIAGDRVVINGILRSVPKFKGDGNLSDTKDLIIEVSSIEHGLRDFEDIVITEEDSKQIKEIAAKPNLFGHLAASIAPSILGMEQMKKAVLLQLFEGAGIETPGGGKRRGTINVLLVSDPGVGKTVLLNFIADIAPRGVYTVATTSSKVGLVAPLVKDETSGAFAIEAGAFMIANGGIICIDEASEMSKEDFKYIEEAMENGCVHINKAGLNTTVQTSASVLMACNPKHGSFDPFEALGAQVEITDSTLSRMDLKILWEDKTSEEDDTAKADFISQMYMDSSAMMADKVPRELLRKYIAEAKRINPKTSPEAAGSISRYYTQIRKQSLPGTMKVTTRQVSSLHTLAQAHARMRMSSVVEAEDADAAINLFDDCLRATCSDKNGMIDAARWNHKSKPAAAVLILQCIKDNNGLATEKAIIDWCGKNGIDESRTKQYLRQLSNEGKLMSPKDGTYREL